MTHLEIHLLGTFEVRRSQDLVTGFASNKVRALLAYLAVESGRAHQREVLAALLWPESSQAAALSSLRNALANLRQSIGDAQTSPAFLKITRSTIQFNSESDYWLDIVEVAKLSPKCGPGHIQLLPAEVRRFSAALECYQGPFLAGFGIPNSDAFEEWSSFWRERLAQQTLIGLKQLADFHESMCEHTTALAFAQRCLALDPLLEDGHRQAMRILALSGKRSEALAQYETCCRTLEAELGVSPSTETTELYAAIRSDDIEKLSGNQAMPAPGVSPYRGLCFFDTQDAELFFGREALTARLAAQIEEMAASPAGHARVLAVVGASGSGKSSLIRAGVVPTLQERGWETKILTPGSHPLSALQACLLPSLPNTNAPRALLVIDQFEELFSLCREEDARAAFLDQVFNLGLWGVVLVLRADFYGHCAAYPQLRAVLSKSQEFIGAIDAGGLRRAIEEPARLGGWQIEPGLTDLLLDEVGASAGRMPEPGALPLLEHALLETWQRRRGRQMTLEGYHAAGGVRGAIAQTAERVYGSLSREDQTLARKLFLRLTELGEGTSDTRRRAALFELRAIGSGPQQVDALLEALTSARLVTLSAGSAEVAHEALIREWPALRRWLSEDRDSLRLHRHLTESAAAWERLGRDEGELYRGTRLAHVMDWAAEGDHPRELTEAENAFLSASKARSEREVREREMFHQRELDAARRLAEAESRRAAEHEEAAIRLYREERLSYARELAAYSSNKLSKEQDLALLLALEAVDILEEAGLALPWDIQQAVHDVAMTARIIWRREVPSGTYMGIYSPDGKIIYYEGTFDVDHVRKYALDAANGEEIFSVRMDGAGLALSSDGKYLAEAGSANAYLLDALNGELVLSVPLHCQDDPIHVGVGAISPDSRYLLVNLDRDTGALVDLEAWLQGGSPVGVSMDLPIKPFGRSSAFCPADTFSPDGKTFTTAWQDDSTIILWDTETLTPLRIFAGHTNLPRINSFSPDGSRMASSSYDGTVRLWDVATGGELMRLSGHTAAIHSVMHSPDGKILSSASNDSLVILWNAATGQRLMDLHAGGPAYQGSFSPDGKRLFTTTLSTVITLWDISSAGRGELASTQGAPDWVTCSPDGSLIAEARADGSVIILDPLSLLSQKQVRFRGIEHAQRLSISQDNQFLSMDVEGHIYVWNLDSQKAVFEVAPKPGWDDHYAFPPSFSPDGSRLASGGYHGKIQIWNLASGQLEHEFAFNPLSPAKLCKFSPDGKRLAAGCWRNIHSGGGRVYIWDLEDARKAPQILVTDQNSCANLSFSSDNRQLATCGTDPVSRVWDVDSGAVRLTLRGHVGSTHMIRYSPDGKFLVTASGDGTAKVWDAQNGACLLSYQTPNGCRMDVACFTPDGRRLVTGGGNQDAFDYWLLAFQDFDELLRIVRARSTRDWKPEERQRYLRQG